MLVLDAGGSLVAHWTSLGRDSALTIAAMNLLGYDALVVGRAELASVLEILEQSGTPTSFPLLSANILDEESGQPVFEPYTILERDGVRIGIIGISEPGARPDDPLRALQRVYPEVHAQADLVIVLSQAGKEMDQALAQQVRGINVIVGGKDRELEHMPLREGNALLVRQGYGGEWMGKLKVTIDSQGAPADYTEEIISLDERYASSQAMVELLISPRRSDSTASPKTDNLPVPSVTAVEK